MSNYNGLQATLTQRPIHGLSYTVGYTFAHALDEASSERGGPLTQNPACIRCEYSNSDFDIRHRFTATFTYALPGRDGMFQLMKGWKLTSIVTVQSALPWGLIGSRGNDPSGIAEFNDRWNFYGNPEDFSGLKTGTVPFFSGAAALANPACTSRAAALGVTGTLALQRWGCFVRNGSVMIPPALGTVGNMTRNMFRGNGLHLWDFSVIKDFRFTERFSGEFRWEVFNLLNSTQYGNPQFNGAGGNDPFGSPLEFGASHATPDVANNNPSLGSGGPREMQVGFKLTF
jgi:hypothetical protein